MPHQRLVRVGHSPAVLAAVCTVIKHQQPYILFRIQLYLQCYFVVGGHIFAGLCDLAVYDKAQSQRRRQCRGYCNNYPDPSLFHA